LRPGPAWNSLAAEPFGELRRDGDIWRVAFGNTAFELPDSKGMHQLAELLAHPGHPYEVVDLAKLLPGKNGDSSAPALDAERARVNVTRSIRAAMQKISERDASLGLYLRATIRTGYRCSYMPEPTESARNRSR
jgi:hypothetical protein